jgi:hypothetical protein
MSQEFTGSALPTADAVEDAALNKLFEMLNRESSNTHKLAHARRPNFAVDHDDELYLGKVRQNGAAVVDALVDAADRICGKKS